MSVPTVILGVPISDVMDREKSFLELHDYFWDNRPGIPRWLVGVTWGDPESLAESETTERLRLCDMQVRLDDDISWRPARHLCPDYYSDLQMRAGFVLDWLADGDALPDYWDALWLLSYRGLYWSKKSKKPAPKQDMVAAILGEAIKSWMRRLIEDRICQLKRKERDAEEARQKRASEEARRREEDAERAARAEKARALLSGLLADLADGKAAGVEVARDPQGGPRLAEGQDVRAFLSMALERHYANREARSRYRDGRLLLDVARDFVPALPESAELDRLDKAAVIRVCERDIAESKAKAEKDKADREKAEREARDAALARELGIDRDDEPEAAGPDWLVDGMFVCRDLTVIAGAEKTMKTSLAVNLAVCIAAGVPFLGHAIPRARPVFYFSNEVGKDKLNAIARGVCEQRGLEWGDVRKNLTLRYRNIILNNPDELKLVAELAKARGVGAVIVDALYKAQDGSIQATDRDKLGRFFAAVEAVFRQAGATPILVDHAKRTADKKGATLGLAGLYGAAIGLAVRQYLTVRRRYRFVPGDTVHKLDLAFGGSGHDKGFSGTLAVDLDEEAWTFDVLGPAGSRKPSPARQDEGPDGDGQRAAPAPAGPDADARDQDAVLAKAEELADAEGTVSLARLQDEVNKCHKIGWRRFPALVKALAESGRVEECEVRVAKGKGATDTARGLRLTRRAA